jgi:hypothetical protein
MHVLQCTIASVLPPGERLSLRAERHDGRFPFWPEHLGWSLAFELPASSDSADAWMVARHALCLAGSEEQLPALNFISIRRLSGLQQLGPRGRLELVVLGVWVESIPSFQLMTPAEGCPTDFGRPSPRTIRADWSEAVHR